MSAGLVEKEKCFLTVIDVKITIFPSSEPSTVHNFKNANAGQVREWTGPCATVTSVAGTALLAAAASPVLSDYFFPVFAVAVAVSWAHGCVVLPAASLLFFS